MKTTLAVKSLPYTLEVLKQLLMVFKDCKFCVEPQLLEECYLLQSYENENNSFYLMCFKDKTRGSIWRNVRCKKYLNKL
jgi:hypothetical protein